MEKDQKYKKTTAFQVDWLHEPPDSDSLPKHTLSELSIEETRTKVETEAIEEINTQIISEKVREALPEIDSIVKKYFNTLTKFRKELFISKQTQEHLKSQNFLLVNQLSLCVDQENDIKVFPGEILQLRESLEEQILLRESESKAHNKEIENLQSEISELHSLRIAYKSTITSLEKKNRDLKQNEKDLDEKLKLKYNLKIKKLVEKKELEENEQVIRLETEIKKLKMQTLEKAEEWKDWESKMNQIKMERDLARAEVEGYKNLGMIQNTDLRTRTSITAPDTSLKDKMEKKLRLQRLSSEVKKLVHKVKKFEKLEEELRKVKAENEGLRRELEKEKSPLKSSQFLLDELSEMIKDVEDDDIR
eukprot:maker-scaffold_3-snap-gene-21.8-mRNA-1 protein AED:0.00 eAED:0.00 QI:37/1/1/1/1/1/2/411/361